MTSSPLIGEALSLRCEGQRRRIELTGGGRTKGAEVCPDSLCTAILEGLVNQMKVDNRIGCSFQSCDPEINHIQLDKEMDTGDKAYDHRGCEHGETLTWSRKDYGTTRLMLPGPNGPLWSSCIRRVTKDLDTNQALEDRPISEVRGKERRREFREGHRT